VLGPQASSPACVDYMTVDGLDLALMATSSRGRLRSQHEDRALK